MPKYNRILCPVDLSENSFAAINIATTFAKQHAAKIVFFYVTPLWDPATSNYGAAYIDRLIEDEKAKLHKLKPADASVEFEHRYEFGNSGPTVVKATAEADMVVMSTHGRGGIARLMMGSVADYVLRNSKCQVILVKSTEIAKESSIEEPKAEDRQSFVTEKMHSVAPVHAYETMESVLKSLNKAWETAAPVVDVKGKCIGVLTTTDIERFHDLQKRYEEKDESVIKEMFEVDEFGQRRTTNNNFDQVERHMTKNVISVRDNQSVEDAVDLFQANPKIHHLVVLDEDDHPVGIVDLLDVDVVASAKNEDAAP